MHLHVNLNANDDDDDAFSEDQFVLAKSADPDEKLHYAAFHLDLSSLFAKVLILVFPVFEVLKTGEASKA